MGDTVETVTGSCTIGGKSYGVNSIVANMAVNTWPTYTVGVIPGNSSGGKAVQVDESVFKQIGQWQGKIIGSGLSASLSWGSSGGVSEHISGYVTAAQQVVRYGDLCMQIVFMPQYTQVDALSFSIYQLSYSFNEDGKNKVSMVSVDGKSLMGYIKAVVEQLFEDWDKYGELAMSVKGMSEQEQKMYQNQHQINKKYVGTFYDLLSNSEGEVGGLYSIGKMKVFGLEAQDSLYETIFNCLVQQQGSFLSCICALGNMFRLIYVPQPNSVGSYIPKANTLKSSNSGGGKNAVVSAQSSVLRSGVLPVGRVFVITDQTGSNCDTASIQRLFDASSASVDISGPYRTIGIAAPPWIPRTARVVKLEKDGKVMEANGMSPDQVASVVQEANSQEDSDKYYEKALHDWCRQELADQLVGGSISSLLTFLDKFECGMRRKEAFGTGFVNGCVVEIRLMPNGFGTANTTYQYTHVFYTGANIPSIN